MRSRGSIFKRCKHPKTSWARCPHSWTVVVTVGKDEDGKPIQIWRTVEGSLTDAEKERTDVLHDHDVGARLAPAASRRWGRTSTTGSGTCEPASVRRPGTATGA